MKTKKLFSLTALIFAVNFFNTFTVSAQVISSGGRHSLFLCNNGSVMSCGHNSNGQLGDGTLIDKNTVVAVSGLNGITALAGGDQQSYALKNDGTVWAWGHNLFGQIGDGTNIDKLTPVAVSSLTGVSGIAGGYLYTLALKNDGTVWAWGKNNYGQLGDGSLLNKNIPVQVVGLTGIIDIAGGDGHSLALKNDGTVWAWGYNVYGQLGDGTIINKTAPVQVIGLTNIIRIANGDGNHSLALKNDGTVWAWGYNYFGELGDGTTNTSGCFCKSTAIQTSSLTGIIAIARGYLHSLALKNDGTVWAWGSNNSGRIGDGTLVDKYSPVMLALTGITSVECGYDHSIALKNDGTAWTWGYNILGELGNGTNINSPNPVQVGGLCSIMTGIEKRSEQNDIAIFPNPSNGYFNFTEVGKDNTIEIYDLTGRLIMTSITKNESVNIDLGAFNNGVYFYKIIGERTYSGKLIKQ